MKKTLVIIIIIFIISTAILSILLIDSRAKNKELQQINSQFEYYTTTEIYGTELITLINKAVDNNEKYNIPKDENENYIPDNQYSVKITIYMLATEQTYQMEAIFRHNIEQFIELFNSSKFKANKIEYHELTGRISKIEFVQTQE